MPQKGKVLINPQIPRRYATDGNNTLHVT